MTSHEEIFIEIHDALDVRIPIKVRYSRLYAILQKICAEQSADFKADYSGLFSRLFAVCREKGIEHYAADRFRRHARMVLTEERSADEKDLLNDAADLCSFVLQIYGCQLPEDLPSRTSSATPSIAKKKGERITCMRMIVEDIANDHFAGWSDGKLYRVEMADDSEVLTLLEKGCSVNLLDVECMDDTAVPYLVILEPDYLIDVSALTACIRPYGRHPLNYFLSRLSPRQLTAPILLGNAANEFMDDCINKGEESDYRLSMQRHFRTSMLDYLYVPGGLPGDYFDSAKQQYEHIKDSVLRTFPSHEVGISVEDAVLEPSFICEALGLRGRLDVMTVDGKKLVELKSGKADEVQRLHHNPKEEHVLQMSLYKEILHYNLGLRRDQINAYLFYSRYPRFFDERSSATAVRHVMHLRNEIVAMEKDLRNGKFDDYLLELTPSVLNTKQMDDSFYHRWLYPQLVEMLRPLQNLTSSDYDLEHRYFTAFLTFIYREQFLSKTNDNRPDSTRGFARTWNADVTTKQLSGDILIDLKIVELEGEPGVERIVFEMPDYGENFIPNFNIGEMVQFYERMEAHDSVLSKQLVRGNIESIEGNYLTLVLAFPQSRHYFKDHCLYAIEHDSTDMSSAQSLRGFYALLKADDDRRDLLLGQRSPEIDTGQILLSQPIAAVRDIVLKAKQARDYFLLVGPPGTGKTNVALNSMVIEFLLSMQAGEHDGAILLMAYTNRAVDEICSMLERVIAAYPFADYVRIGAEGSCHPDYRHRLLKSKAEGLKNRREAHLYLQQCPIVVGTVMTMTNHLNLLENKKFRVALIDEASQVLEPQILGLLTTGPAFPFIMIGDHKQLPAVVLQTEQQSAVQDETLQAIGLKNLRNSLFERLYEQAKEHGDDYAIAHLTHQGRMHKEICDFVSKEFYEGRLYALGLSHQEGELQLPYTGNDALGKFLCNVRMGFIDVPMPVGQMIDNPKANACEAQCAAQVVAMWEQLLGEDYEAERIGIIVPFRAQMGRVKAELRQLKVKDWERITVDTVECYQGSQRDFILFTTTVSRRGQMAQLSELHDIEGVEVDRKLNVAITRARRQFILVGNQKVLQTSALYGRLMKVCQQF